MKPNVNQLLNHFLYSFIKEKEDDKYDQNILKTLNILFKNNEINDDFLIEKINSSKKSINANYDWNDDKYYDEFFEKYNLLNYYGSSLSDNKNGLERSQLKTLTSVINNIYENNRYLAINGAPGTGKSTLLNYIISNLLIKSLLSQYKFNSNLYFSDFLKNKYKVPKIFLTGLTKNSVKNVSEICEINFPNQHRWITLSNNDIQEQINNIFNSLDIHFSNDDKKEENTIKNKSEEIQNKYLIKNIIDYKDELKLSFTKSFCEYFKFQNVQWEKIPDYLYKKLNDNVKIIKNINSVIKDIFKDSIKDKIDFYINQISFQNRILNINKSIIKFKTQKQRREKIIIHLWIEFNELLNFIKENFNIDFPNENFKFIDKFIRNYEKIKNKSKKVFSNLKKCIKIIYKFWQSKFDFQYIKNYFRNLNDSLNKIKEIFSSEELKELSFDNEIDLNSEISDSKMINLMLTLDIVKINFNNIQQKIDINYRNENIFIYRHICEWLFIDNIKSNHNISDLHILKPIISSNLQSFNLNNISKIWNIKNNKMNLIDYAIIDEASQASWKYVPFLLYLFKNIIAVGDEKQLPPKDIDDLTISSFNKFKNTINNNECFNDSKAKLIYENLLNQINNLLKSINLYNFEEKKCINESVLEWINNNFEIVSELKSTSKNGYSIVKQKGLFLLEHFRCPYHIFNLFNKSFYNNTLSYNKENSECSCSFSKHSNLLCNEISFIQLKYDFDEHFYNENSNLSEAKIALNFIVDNLEYFLEHNNMQISNIDEESVNYLTKNVLLISFYKNQNMLINSIVQDINNYLDNYLSNSNFEENNHSNNESKNVSYSIFNKIKSKYNKNQIFCINDFLKNLNIGTVDSTQGLGADFIIISNVSRTIFNEKIDRIRTFENDFKRINVFWSRTKKHFIQIISNTYWDDMYKINQSDLDSISLDGLKSRKLAEIFIDDNFNKIIFDINWKSLNNDLSIINLWNVYKYKENIIDLKSKMNHIGKYGETIFNIMVNDNLFSKLLSKKIFKQLDLKIRFISNTNWLNKESESGKQYDFNIGKDYFVDVKSTINNGDLVYISELELHFINKNLEKYLIVKINDIRKFNLNIKNKSSLAFIFDKINFYKFIDNKLKNNFNSIKYELRK